MSLQKIKEYTYFSINTYELGIKILGSKLDVLVHNSAISINYFSAQAHVKNSSALPLTLHETVNYQGDDFEFQMQLFK
jgi:hypothetical protein